MGPGMAALAIEDTVTHFRSVWRSRWLAVLSTLSVNHPLGLLPSFFVWETERKRYPAPSTTQRRHTWKTGRRSAERAPPTNANESLPPACCFPSSVCHWQLPSLTEGHPSAGQDGKRKASKWCRGWLARVWVAPYPSCPIFSPIFLQHLLWEFPTGTCVVENKLTRLREKRALASVSPKRSFLCLSALQREISKGEQNTCKHFEHAEAVRGPLFSPFIHSVPNTIRHNLAIEPPSFSTVANSRY
ncbi:hypothetical protein CKAH01_15105 [Colletotrichum kahawae]|uniref:Uncharacterized protein n=1 Tax=Colletotrichum kahawae TaxID=34407 RepID=A0AAD9YKY3_COLKA|nr:hypothetical protein CKAH01_15105 [Colletotrichum kahawae]